MSDLQDLLGRHRFFKDLTPAMIATLAGHATLRREREGRFAVHEGDPAGLLVVLSGRLRVETHGPGRPGSVLETLVAGEVFGSSWVFPPYRWTFDVQVVQDAEFLAFDGPALRALVETDLPLGNALLQRLVRALTERLRSARMQLTDVYRHPGAGAEGSDHA